MAARTGAEHALAAIGRVAGCGDHRDVCVQFYYPAHSTGAGYRRTAIRCFKYDEPSCDGLRGAQLFRRSARRLE